MAVRNASEKAETAKALFLEGYSCAQAVYAAFAPEMGLSEKQALLSASGMGGGLGGLRLTCGAVTGMVMALGGIDGYNDPQDAEGKKRVYAQVQALHQRFTDVYGTSVCAALLEANGITPQSAPAERTPEYYRTRPCVRYVETCARLLAEELSK